ncbi:hypothetical protein NDU88_007643 [Pleurodeles waltl]|uniref:Uncharacterized protein n=1 Tax=Pleurodeles waltl TaxID=8319 RepID=A0AAV7P1E7_PLEWA|nr:hypothetical protein NDU88_007643 [Pleurodeles waltl]
MQRDNSKHHTSPTCNHALAAALSCAVFIPCGVRICHPAPPCGIQGGEVFLPAPQPLMPAPSQLQEAPPPVPVSITAHLYGRQYEMRLHNSRRVASFQQLIPHAARAGETCLHGSQ